MWPNPQFPADLVTFTENRNNIFRKLWIKNKTNRLFPINFFFKEPNLKNLKKRKKKRKIIRHALGI